MNVNFEFLDEEQLENIISCLHYRFDKVVFFGYQNVIDKNRESLDRFLKTKCNITETDYITLSSKKISKTLATMKKFVDEEINDGNDLYFDLTGGEELILVAFGMLNAQNHYPVFEYRIDKDMFINMSEEEDEKCNLPVPAQDIKFSLKDVIGLRGGIIRDDKHKEEKDIDDEEYIEDINKVWELSRSLNEDWTKYATTIGKIFKSSRDKLNVRVSTQMVEEKLYKQPIRNKGSIDRLLDELSKAGLIKNYSNRNSEYSFSYKNEKVKSLLIVAGDVLEMHTFLKVRELFDDCIVGANLDWDGKVTLDDKDVTNEIDVLGIKDNTLTFISCKDGKHDSEAPEDELYKLDTVGKRFGGKYYKMFLLSSQGVSESKIARADAMNIKVIKDIDIYLSEGGTL